MQDARAAGTTGLAPRTPRGGSRRFGPGEEPDEVRAGDLIFRAGNQHEMSVAISCGQFLRPDTRPHARWNHVMLVLDEAGRTAHATGKGMTEGRLRDLRDQSYVLVPVDCSDEDRAHVVAFAEDALARGATWGWVTAASELLTLLTGCRIVFAQLGTMTCSGFVAEALLRTGVIFDRPAALMSPADLAKAYDLPGAIRARDVPPTVWRARPLLARVRLRPARPRARRS
jgi:hypothetical protein